ncbi:MAG: IS1 family transposase [Acidobacteriia bacterium]|nr:IS1 family transposase [Terriglobia bacterium]
MNKLTTAKRIQVVAALVEGNSIRATVRMTGTAKNTVIKLLVELGGVCARYQDEALHDLYCEHVQADEIWSFCYAKTKNVPQKHQGEFGYGDVWTFTAIDADTKLVPSWMIGPRDLDTATAFMQDLVSRIHGRVQLTTDGHSMYLDAVDAAFGSAVDFAQLQKLYGVPPDVERRYSPAVCIGTNTQVVQGNPDAAHISTSYVERQNLTMRMSMRRFTRLTNGFSKKLDNLMAAVSLHFMHYNFCRPHKTLKGKTPAMAAGVANHTWAVREVVALLG